MGDPHTSLPVGTILKEGEYTILGKIGEGGFSITYAARQNSLNRKVCVKEYFLDGRCFRGEDSLRVECKPSFTELFEKYRKAFVHEAEMVASISHHNVVDVIGVFQENNTAYMVMQFIEGQTLESLVAKRGALPLDEARNYMSQIAEAVGYIHDRNILHRDIKPSNIMITHDFRAILIDFGSAREFVDDKTQAHTSMLTRSYAPPEQYSTVSRKGRYSDIYSLGATLYYVLTATPPVDAAARMTEPFPEPASLNLAIPARINNAIMKAMQTNPADRYQDVHGFVSELWSDIQKRREDKTWLWILLAILACLIIVGIVALVHNSGSASPKDTAKQKDEIKAIKEAKQTITVNGVSFDMVYVEGGTFTMGCTSEQGGDCEDNEKPAHQVTLSSYYIGEIEVTQALWKAVMGSNPSQTKGNNLPMSNVNWDDIQTFIERLNIKTGKTFRLPTEAEWEYAARGGNKSQGYKYSGSENIDEVAWYDGNSEGRIHPVRTKSPNELGLYDMSGNVWEWCSDCYDSYSSLSQTNPTGPSTDLNRVLRGGSFGNFAKNCRVLIRLNQSPSRRGIALGFRLVLDNDDESKKDLGSDNGLQQNPAEPTTAINYPASGSKQTVMVGGVSFDMVYVESGTFMMGCTSEQGSDCRCDEKPVHSVTLSSYYIGETEVTQALWKAVMGNNPSDFKGDNLPVEGVSWDDAHAFIRELNRKTGRTFRLPTEAEWEYAARGGSKSRRYMYSGSEIIDNVAWYSDNSGRKTHPIKTKKPNELGLYDMNGNVWEWCSDWNGSYSSSPQTNPTGPSTGSTHVLRGGNWTYSAMCCRVSYRYYGSPSCRSSGLGFRLVLVQ